MCVMYLGCTWFMHIFHFSSYIMRDLRSILVAFEGDYAVFAQFSVFFPLFC